MNIMDKIFPRRFVRHSLATHLSGVFAVEPAPLRLSVEEAKARLAATPAAEIRALAQAAPEARRSLAEYVPMMPTEAPTEAPETFCACIPIVGMIVRGDASCARMMGLDATGLEEIECALEAASSDPSVAEICLEITSPGGVAAGIQELADLITEIRKTKPVRAEISALCASAAYWIAAACSSIEAEPSALVGSIGVYSVIEDSSRAYESIGVKVHVVRSGALKGAGTEGTKVTDAQLVASQVVVDDLAALFSQAIATGRGLSAEAVKALATGEVWIASKALERGLIDSISSAASPAANTAPTGAITEATMENKNPVAAGPAAADDALRAELERMKGELAQARAKEEITKAAADEQARAAKVAIIDTHAKAGRVTPAMRATIDAKAEHFGAQELDEFLGSLPVQTRSIPSGGAPKATDADQELDEIDRKLMAAMRITADMALAAKKGV